MTSKWVFPKKTAGWLGLACPTCSNKTTFEGIKVQDHLIWKCAVCGNYLQLNLIDLTDANTK